MSSYLDILGDLLPLSWRGIDVPCQANEMSGGHSLVEHNQYGVAGGEQESCCRKSVRFSFRVPFRVGIAGYEGLYPQTFRDFWNACLDGSTGPLIHPELGLVDCKVDTFKAVYDPQRRDGVDMDVVWAESIELGISVDIAAESPINTAIGLAGDLEDIATDVEVPEYDDGSGLSLKQALAKIKGTIQLAEMSVVNSLNDISNTISAVNDMIDYAGTLTHPESYAILDALKGIESNLQTLKEKTLAGRKKRIAIRVTTSDMRVTYAAAKFGMTIEEFFGLNPLLAVSTTVKAGSEILVWQT